MTNWVLILLFYYHSLEIPMYSKQSCEAAAQLIVKATKDHQQEPTAICIQR